MTRARFRLFQEIQPLKNRFRRLLHVLFPELQGFFSNLYGNTSMNLLSVLPSAKDIAECNILKLTKILSEFSRGMLKRGRAEQLKSLAQNSIATYNYGDAFELKQTVRRIQFLSSQMSEIESEIDSVMAVLNSPITSIPGIGNLLGATILSEIGDIKNFDNPDKLLAFLAQALAAVFYADIAVFRIGREAEFQISALVYELDRIFKRIYEDDIGGTISHERFLKLSADYEAEQKGLTEQVKIWREAVETFEQDKADFDSFAAIVQKYVGIRELTPTIVNEFVKKIIVHAPDKSSGHRRQKIQIIWNFVGKLKQDEDKQTIERERKSRTA